MPAPRTRLGICALLALTVGLSRALVPAGVAASTPSTFAPFKGSGPGYSYSFAKPVRSTRPGVVTFQFPGTLHVPSVRAPLYTLVTAFVLFVQRGSPKPSVTEENADIARDCLGRFSILQPVPAGSTGFAYECRPNTSEWMCTRDLEQGSVRVALYVTAPKKDQCVPYAQHLVRVFFRKAGLTAS